MEEKLLTFYRLLIELRDCKKVPKKYRRDLDRSIFQIEEIIKKPKSLNEQKSFLERTVQFFLKYFNSQ